MTNNDVPSRAGATRRTFLSASAVTAVAVPLLSGSAQASTDPALAPQEPDFELRALLREIDPDRIKATILRLVQFGTRHTASSQTDPVRGIGAATAWVFAQLKAAFPTWEQTLSASAGDVADAIRCGGIADQKARRIQQILAAIREREGRIDLSRLRDLGDGAVEEYLTSLPGVGPKTAACVLVFSMGRAAFPVDTHVHRVALRLGWIPPDTTAEKAHRILGSAVPPGIRYDLHVALIEHGRTVCKAQRPRCGACVLRDECAYRHETAERAATGPR